MSNPTTGRTDFGRWLRFSLKSLFLLSAFVSEYVSMATSWADDCRAAPISLGDSEVSAWVKASAEASV